MLLVRTASDTPDLVASHSCPETTQARRFWEVSKQGALLLGLLDREKEHRDLESKVNFPPTALPLTKAVLTRVARPKMEAFVQQNGSAMPIIDEKISWCWIGLVPFLFPEVTTQKAQ